MDLHAGLDSPIQLHFHLRTALFLRDELDDGELIRPYVLVVTGMMRICRL